MERKEVQFEMHFGNAVFSGEVTVGEQDPNCEHPEDQPRFETVEKLKGALSEACYADIIGIHDELIGRCELPNDDRLIVDGEIVHGEPVVN